VDGTDNQSHVQLHFKFDKRGTLNDTDYVRCSLIQLSKEEKLMKYLTHIFILFAAMSFGVAPGAPGKAQGKGPKTFESLDKDGDHKLTKEELATAPKMSADFEQIDANKDGSISEDELTAYRAAHQGQRMGR
jgi:hypothetical protein